MTGRVRAARPEDVPAMVGLLQGASLPIDGVEHLIAVGDAFVIGTGDDAVVGCVALERLDGQVLLRSLVVDGRHRGRGLGGQILRAALGSVPPDDEVWALTETAEDFLRTHGFTAVARDDVRGAIRSTTEWTFLCPDTAVSMVRRGGVW